MWDFRNTRDAHERFSSFHLIVIFEIWLRSWTIRVCDLSYGTLRQCTVFCICLRSAQRSPQVIFINQGFLCGKNYVTGADITSHRLWKHFKHTRILKMTHFSFKLLTQWCIVTLIDLLLCTLDKQSLLVIFKSIEFIIPPTIRSSDVCRTESTIHQILLFLITCLLLFLNYFCPPVKMCCISSVQYARLKSTFYGFTMKKFRRWFTKVFTHCI